MPAYGKPIYFGGHLILHPMTVRMTRNGKVAHLFVNYVNGATNGYPISFCDLVTDHRQKWREDHNKVLPLCNRCGRGFHKVRRRWRGLP